MADAKFRKQLEDSINNADEKLDRHELLIDIFKTYVAKMLQVSMEHGSGEKKDRLEMSALIKAKQELINEFRGAALGMYQRSTEDYEKLFAATLEEIFNDASNAHKGEDSVKYANQNLEINKDAYVNEGGLYVPKGMKR